MTCGEYTCIALAACAASLTLGACAIAGDHNASPAVDPAAGSARADAVVQRHGPKSSTAIPTVAKIQIYFKLDPRLTRGMNMGDRWVSPASFTTVRQSGKQGTVEAKAVGLDDRGQLLNRHLEVEWLAPDRSGISVSPPRGNSVTITMRSPGESMLRVKHGDVYEALTINATYDELHDLTQLSFSTLALR